MKVSLSGDEEGEWKVAPLRRDILVLTVGESDDAVGSEGVTAAEVVFVVRRGWVKDIAQWPGRRGAGSRLKCC